MSPTRTRGPTTCWRADPAEAPRFPGALLDLLDAAFERFEAELAALGEPSDGQVFTATRNVVLALNTLDREEVCDYIDQSLTDTGIDVEALAARRGTSRAEITGEWREW